MNILDNFKNLLFCYHIFGAIGTIDVLDPENQPGSLDLGLTKDKKEGIYNYLHY